MLVAGMMKQIDMSVFSKNALQASFPRHRAAVLVGGNPVKTASKACRHMGPRCLNEPLVLQGVRLDLPARSRFGEGRG